MNRLCLAFIIAANCILAADPPQYALDSLTAARAKWQAVCPPAHANITLLWITDDSLGDAFAYTADTVTRVNAFKYTWPTTASGMDLDSVILHEVGLALGLKESDTPDSIMCPSPTPHDFIHIRDIDTIQALYNFTPPPLPVSVVKRGRNVLFSVSSDQPCYWDFGDGVVISLASAQIVHRYPARGVYTVTVRSGSALGMTTVQVGAPRRHFQICKWIKSLYK